MRVLMLSDVYFPRVNGVSTAIRTYRDALAAEGVEVRLVAPAYGGEAAEAWVRRVPAKPVPGDPEDRRMDWRALGAAVEAELAGGVDLVHVQTPFLAHYAARRARRLGVPVIATYHTLFEEYAQHYAPFLPPRLLRLVARRLSAAQCRELDAVIVPSQAIQTRLTDYGVRTPLYVLPTGIPLQDFAGADGEAFRARHGIPAERPVALYVGRVAHEKNIGFLLDMLEIARRALPALLLLIAGEGPALPALRSEVARRGLGDQLRFLGYLDRRDELPACYAAADAFVFASRTETQGLVLLEAMASGLPVVALALMGTVDVLAPRRGAVVPLDDVADFARQLVQLLRDPLLRRELAAEGRSYVCDWSDKALAARLAALYRELAGERAAARPLPAAR